MKNLSKYFAAALVSLSLVACSSKAPDVASSSSPSPSPSASESSSNDQTKVLSDKALSLLGSGDYKGAKDIADQLVSKSPDNPGGYGVRAGAELGLKEYQSSLDDYNKTISLAPQLGSNPDVLQSKAIAEYNVQKVDDAKADVQKTADLYKSAGREPNYQFATSLLGKFNAGEPVDINTK
jgi:tetratricopeptide (TPR) repeat protein